MPSPPEPTRHTPSTEPTRERSGDLQADQGPGQLRSRVGGGGAVQKLPGTNGEKQIGCERRVLPRAAYCIRKGCTPGREGIRFCHRMAEDGVACDGVEELAGHEGGEALDPIVGKTNPFAVRAGHADEMAAGAEMRGSAEQLRFLAAHDVRMPSVALGKAREDADVAVDIGNGCGTAGNLGECCRRFDIPGLLPALSAPAMPQMMIGRCAGAETAARWPSRIV